MKDAHDRRRGGPEKGMNGSNAKKVGFSEVAFGPGCIQKGLKRKVVKSGGRC